MIHADIQGKAGVPEDRLTSNSLGLLRLLSDEYFIEILGQSLHLCGHRINLGGMTVVKELVFWPWLAGGGEPDVLATLESGSGSQSHKVVIEVKHGSEKSGGEDDQLVRYYKAAKRLFPSYQVSLIYLTHHRYMPVDDLKASLAHLAGEANIYWLSWYAVTKWSADRHKKLDTSTTDARIMDTIRNYLTLKGYSRFDHLVFPQDIVRVKPIYTRSFVSDENCRNLCCPQLYHRNYLKQSQVSQISSLYSR